jgi:triacylglycerol lipase
MPELIRDIVLAHGIARFSILSEILINTGTIPESDNLHYFKGIASHLRANGFNVHTTNVDFAGPIEDCARELADQIKSINQKVHIIGHSQGGLNSRHAIVDHGIADNVAMLTTIDTPHLGTSFADHALTPLGRLFIEVVRPVLNIDGFQGLTTAQARAFNDRAADAEAKNAVIYRTYSASEARERIFFPLRPSWKIIRDHEGGENDGLVSVKSQDWNDTIVAADGTTKPIQHFSFPFGADHLNACGWYDPAEHTDRAQYEAQVKEVYLQIANSGMA